MTYYLAFHAHIVQLLTVCSRKLWAVIVDFRVHQQGDWEPKVYQHIKQSPGTDPAAISTSC